MRRKDREITNTDQINKIINKTDHYRIGFNDNGQVYMKQATGKDNWDIPNTAIDAVAVLKIVVTNLSAKVHQ